MASTLLPHSNTSQNHTTKRSDYANQIAYTQGRSRLARNGSQRSSGGGDPSQNHHSTPIGTGPFQLSLSAGATTSLATEMEQTPEGMFGDASSSMQSFLASQSTSLIILPKEEEKSAAASTPLKKSSSMGSTSVPRQRRSRMAARGTKTRKVIHLTSTRPNNRIKHNKTVAKANCLQGPVVFSSSEEEEEETSSKEEEVDHRMSQDNICDFRLSPAAYQSKGEGVVLLNTRSLGQKYQPKIFRDIAGHEISVMAISNAVEKKKIAPLYLFHGPSGTGKTSTARILAMALNCESTSPTKPCWSCRGCSRSLYIMELCSGSRISGFEKIKTLLHSTSFTQSVPGFKVLIIEECHSFTAEAWDELLALVQGSRDSTVVFVLITTAANKVPRNISSRCQKFGFPKLKDKDIALKLEKIVAHEDMSIEREAVKLIIAKSEGSLREAENILDQLALLGSTINSSMVQQLVGLVPQNKLIDLLETAVSGDTIKTIRLAKELITHVEPQALVSQLASLITDILSGAAVADQFSSAGSSNDKRLLRSSRSRLANTQSARLCHALKILVETERQLRCSSDQTSGVLVSLLKISSDDVYNRTSELLDMEINEPSTTVESIHRRDKTQRCRGKEAEKMPNWAHMGDMEKIWQDVLERIQSTRMKEFLFHQVKLASLSVSRANAIVHLMFKRPEDKMAAQMSEESISKALKIAIGCPVTMNMSLEPVALGIVEENTIFTKTKLVDFKQHQRTPFSTEFIPSRNIAHLIKAQEASPLYENSMPTKLKDCSTSLGQDRCLSKGKEATTAPPQQLSPFPGIRTQENNFHTLADPEREILTRERTSIDTVSDKAKHRWLSLSSILQTDASVEPYSQDILFENANNERESKARKNPKYRKGFSKATEDHHSQDTAIQAKLTRSWSCIDKLCLKKNE